MMERKKVDVLYVQGRTTEGAGQNPFPKTGGGQGDQRVEV